MDLSSIVRSARDGDPDALDVLGLWLQGELHTFFARAYSQRDRVHELIQAAALDIIRKLAQAPDDPELFRRWVRGFAGMTARGNTRDRGRERARAADGITGTHTPAESASVVVLDPLLREQQRQLILEHAQRLRPAHRNALLHVLDGGDYKSLAACEGITLATAASRLSYAKKKLRQSIQAARRTRRPFRTPPSHA